MASTASRVTAGQSPLKRVNVPGSVQPRLKHDVDWTQLTTDAGLFNAKSPAASARFFAETFCLRPSVRTIESCMDKLDVQDMLGPFRVNMTALFTNAVKILREAPSTDSRKANVVNTLIPFLRNLLSRKFGNFSYEVMTILTGGLERSDAVFTDLVCAIDMTLGDSTAALELRHRTLQLALILVSSINQGSITAYFLRRDLFSTLVAFMEDDETAMYVFESALLLGLLANFRKFEARNSYGVRIEDFVEDVVMSRIIDVVRTVCYKARDSFIRITDDAPPSFVASLTSLVTSFRLSELLSSFSMTLPPPPPPRSPSIRSPKDADKTPSVSPLAASDGTLGGSDVDSLPKDKDQSPAAVPAQSNTTESPTSNSTGPKHANTERREEGLFRKMPPEIIVILLPFFDLLNLNKAFCALVYSETSSGALPPAIISLSSYVVCHAAVSSRARAYARLCLLIMLVLVEEGEGKLTVESDPVRLCRQRQPMLPHDTSRRPLMCAILDTAVIFLRHNLRKRLDVEAYVVCLKLVQRSMQQLKTERVRLDYDWLLVWRSVLGMAGFVASNLDDLRLTSNKVDNLISQIFVVLCYPAYWGEHFLPDTRTSALLYYELLHADSTLRALEKQLGVSTATSPMLSPTRTGFGHPRDSVSSSSLFSLSSGRPLYCPTSPESKHRGFNGLSSPSLGNGVTVSGQVAVECVANIRSIVEHFKFYMSALSIGSSRAASAVSSPQPEAAHASLNGGGGSSLSDPDVVGTPDGSSSESCAHTTASVVDLSDVDPTDLLALIERNVSGVELVESAHMADMRRGDGAGGSGQEAYFKGLMNVVCGDTLMLIPLASSSSSSSG